LSGEQEIERTEADSLLLANRDQNTASRTVSWTARRKTRAHAKPGSTKSTLARDQTKAQNDAS
jgi:hypothetical protein